MMFSILGARVAGSRGHGRTDGAWLLPDEEFHRVLDRERARADRASTGFSLVVVDGTGAPASRVHAALDVLKGRRRLTDDIGWFGRKAVGVLLPETGTAGAYAYLDHLHSQLAEAGCDLPTQLFRYGGSRLGVPDAGDPRPGDRRQGDRAGRPANPIPVAVAARSRPREAAGATPHPRGASRLDFTMFLRTMWAVLSGRTAQ